MTRIDLGNYSLRVPAAFQTTLQYGYGGYSDKEMQAGTVAAASEIVLQPQAGKRRHWLFF